MELIRYWTIVYRRWWLVMGLLVIVGTASSISFDWSPDEAYVASFRVNVGLEPIPPDDAAYEYNPLEVWMASEYFMDDLASAVRRTDYARRVAARLGEEDINLAGVFGSSTEYRVLTVSITWGNDEQLAQIANAAVAVLQEESNALVGPLGKARPVLRLIDPPVVVPVGRSLKDRLDIPIRLGLALVAGVAGAFLLDYLDATIRDQHEVEALGIPVLAQIPRHQ
jgi:capsular polysaccharide biosynthesis protein